MSDRRDQNRPSSPSLFDFISARLLGSSLQVANTSDQKIVVDAGDIVALTATLDTNSKKVDFALFSKILNRDVTVERINGIVFLESRLEEELEKENRLAIGEDILLVIDLINLWGKENGYSVTHEGVEETTTTASQPPRPQKGRPAKPSGKLKKQQ